MDAKTQESPIELERNSNLGQTKTTVNVGYLLCALSLLLMGVLSMVAQNTAPPEWMQIPLSDAPRTFVILGVLPLIGSIVFFMGVILATVKYKTKLYVIASVLSLPYVIYTYFIFVLVGHIQMRTSTFRAMINWSPLRSPNDFLARNFFVLQILFVLVVILLLLIPFTKKGIVYQVVSGSIILLNFINIIIFLRIELILFAFTGMSNTIQLGANYFGIREMAVVVPIFTAIGLIWASFVKVKQNEELY